MNYIIDNFKHAIMITLFVFIMMILIDYLEVLTQGKMGRLIRGGLFRQYVMSSFLGSTPGCLGAFMNVSFYMHGLISFGALAGGMIATSGDEAFVMLAMFPEKALILFVILFFIGIITSFTIDKLVPVLKLNPRRECISAVLHQDEDCRSLNFREVLLHIRHISFIRFLLLAFLLAALYLILAGVIVSEDWDWKRITFVLIIILAIYIVVTVPDHYLHEHIWEHIGKKHIWRVFLWTLGALLLVDIGFQSLNIEYLLKQNMILVLLIACIIGIIPESGPHLIIVTLFAKDLVPFSVLVASSIVQDGHGMLPLLAHSIKDSVIIKIINFFIGLGLGLLIYAFGY